jgi:HK97 family phage prohead protease
MTIFERRAPVRGNSYDPQTRTFEATIATTAPVERRDLDGLFLEILDLDQQFPASVPVLDGHRSGSVANVLGKATGFRVEGGSLVATVKLGSRAVRDGVAADIEAGILDALSIGYSVDEWREQNMNGMRSKIAISWKLHEVSLVPIPADQGAKVREAEMPTEIETERRVRAASRRALETLADEAGLDDAFVEECEDRNLSEREARALAFEQLRARSQTDVRNTRSHNEITHENPHVRRAAMAEALVCRITGAQPSETAMPFYRDGYTTLSDAARDCLDRAGERTTGLNGARLIARAMETTSDYPALLTEVGNRMLAPAFQAALSPVVTLARRKSAPDFRAFSELRLGTDMRLEKVNEAGELKAGSFVESKEAMRIASYGKTYTMSFQAIANDDLSAFSRITSDLAGAAANTVSDLVIGLIIANPKLGDNVNLFHATHSNLSTTGSALSETSIAAAMLAMRKQRGIAGEMIRVEPTTLIVPPELELTARKLLAAVQATSVDDVNPFAGAFQLMVEPRLTDAAAWYLVDPSLGDLCDAYLSGYDGPQIETRQGWSTLGSEWRVHMHYGCAFMGFRGWHKATGQD